MRQSGERSDSKSNTPSSCITNNLLLAVSLLAEASDRSVNSAASVMSSEMAGDTPDASPESIFGDEAPPFDSSFDVPPPEDSFDAGFEDDESSFSTEGGGGGGEDSGINSVMSSIWDAFNDD